MDYREENSGYRWRTFDSADWKKILALITVLTVCLIGIAYIKLNQPPEAKTGLFVMAAVLAVPAALYVWISSFDRNELTDGILVVTPVIGRQKSIVLADVDKVVKKTIQRRNSEGLEIQKGTVRVYLGKMMTPDYGEIRKIIFASVKCPIEEITL